MDKTARKSWIRGIVTNYVNRTGTFARGWIEMDKTEKNAWRRGFVLLGIGSLLAIFLSLLSTCEITSTREEIGKKVDSVGESVDSVGEKVDNSTETIVAAIDNSNESIVAAIDNSNESIVATIRNSNEAIVAAINNSNESIVAALGNRPASESNENSNSPTNGLFYVPEKSDSLTIYNSLVGLIVEHGLTQYPESINNLMIISFDDKINESERTTLKILDSQQVDGEGTIKIDSGKHYYPAFWNALETGIVPADYEGQPFTITFTDIQ